MPQSLSCICGQCFRRAEWGGLIITLCDIQLQAQSGQARYCSLRAKTNTSTCIHCVCNPSWLSLLQLSVRPLQAGLLLCAEPCPAPAQSQSRCDTYICELHSTSSVRSFWHGSHRFCEASETGAVCGSRSCLTSRTGAALSLTGLWLRMTADTDVCYLTHANAIECWPALQATRYLLHGILLLVMNSLSPGIAFVHSRH
jgi:hypothetical protein